MMRSKENVEGKKKGNGGVQNAPTGTRGQVVKGRRG